MKIPKEDLAPGQAQPTRTWTPADLAAARAGWDKAPPTTDTLSPFVGDLTGVALFERELRRRTSGAGRLGGLPGDSGGALFGNTDSSKKYEEAVLGMPYRSGDAEYNRAVDEAKAKVLASRVAREKAPEPGPSPTGSPSAAASKDPRGPGPWSPAAPPSGAASATPPPGSSAKDLTAKQLLGQDLAQRTGGKARYAPEVGAGNVGDFYVGQDVEDVVLGMGHRDGNAEYNTSLDYLKGYIHKAREKRAGPPLPPGVPPGGGLEGEKAAEDAEASKPLIIGPTGIPIGAGPEADKAIAAGQFIYVGRGPGGLIPDGKGGFRQDSGVLDRDQFIHTDQAQKILAARGPVGIATFQRQFGLAETGVMDKDTFTIWSEVLSTATRMAMAGQKVELEYIINILAKANAVNAVGSGAGGGSGAVTTTGGAKAALNKVMQAETGREATDAEQKAFLADVTAAAKSKDFDATQFTSDWVRGRRGAEAGSYEAATDYYSVMMSALGAQL